MTGITKDVAEKHLLLSIYGHNVGIPKSDEEVLRHIAAATGKPLVGEREIQGQWENVYFHFADCPNSYPNDQ